MTELDYYEELEARENGAGAVIFGLLLVGGLAAAGAGYWWWSTRATVSTVQQAQELVRSYYVSNHPGGKITIASAEGDPSGWRVHLTMVLNGVTFKKLVDVHPNGQMGHANA